MSEPLLYDEHCRALNMAYLLAYEEWENSLSPADRVLLGRAAVPDLEDWKARTHRREVLGVMGDASDRPSASFTPDLAEALDGGADQLSELAGLPIAMARVVHAFMQERIKSECARRESETIMAIAGPMLNATNPKLLAAGLAYASDLAVTAGMGTMQDWALQNGVSRAAVSKVAKFWQRELGLPAGSHMRDETKCRAYSEAQKTKHWRNQKVKSVALEAEGENINEQ